MNSMDIIGTLIIIAVVTGIFFILRNYFSINAEQIKTKNNLLSNIQADVEQNIVKYKHETFLDNDKLNPSEGQTITESNSKMSTEKFDGTNLNPEHSKFNTINEHVEKNIAITEAAKMGEVFDIANESAINQPQDKLSK